MDSPTAQIHIEESPEQIFARRRAERKAERDVELLSLIKKLPALARELACQETTIDEARALLKSATVDLEGVRQAALIDGRNKGLLEGYELAKREHSNQQAANARRRASADAAALGAKLEAFRVRCGKRNWRRLAAVEFKILDGASFPDPDRVHSIHKEWKRPRRRRKHRSA
jgi:hypothetical protein